MLPFLRGIAAKFRKTPQLAHMAARDIHELQHHIREAHRDWEEVKISLKHIRDLLKDIPEGPHHKAVGQVFKYVDTFSDVERRYDKRLHQLKKHVKQLEKGLEAQKKD